MTPTHEMRTASTILLLVAATLLIIATSGGAQEQSSVEHDVHLEDDHLVGEPQAALEYSITIENYADEAVFTFEVPENESNGFQIVVPNPVRLEPGQRDDPTVLTVKMPVYTPFYNGYVNDESQVTVTVHANHATNEEVQGDPTTLHLTAQAKGLYVPHPLIAPLAALGLGAALLAPSSRQPAPKPRRRAKESRDEEA